MSVARPTGSLIVGEADGRMVAAASLFMTDGVGWQSWASVLPAARGHGFQRALIAARTRLAAEAGCDIVAAWALAGAHSSDNLARAGLRRIGQRVVVRAVRPRLTIGALPYDAAVSAMSTGSLRVERTGPAGVVARVTLARPEVHNAFDAGLIAELRTAFALLAREGPDGAPGGHPGR